MTETEIQQHDNQQEQQILNQQDELVVQLEKVQQLQSLLDIPLTSTCSSFIVHPRGLLNVHNTCFLNVLIQSLISFTPFFNFFVELEQRLAQIEYDFSYSLSSHYSALLSDLKKTIPLTIEWCTFIRECRKEAANSIRSTSNVQNDTQSNQTVDEVTNGVATVSIHARKQSTENIGEDEHTCETDEQTAKKKKNKNKNQKKKKAKEEDEFAFLEELDGKKKKEQKLKQQKETKPNNDQPNQSTRSTQPTSHTQTSATTSTADSAANTDESAEKKKKKKKKAKKSTESETSADVASTAEAKTIDTLCTASQSTVDTSTATPSTSATTASTTIADNAQLTPPPAAVVASKECESRKSSHNTHIADMHDQYENEEQVTVSKSSRRRRRKAQHTHDDELLVSQVISLQSSPSAVAANNSSRSAPFLPSFPTLLSLFTHSTHAQQQDTQELFQLMCQQLQKEFTEMKKLINQEREKLGLQIEEEIQPKTQYQPVDDWNQIGKKSKKMVVNQNLSLSPSPYVSLFSFRLRSELSVASRSTSSLSFQPFFCLHLSISSKDIHTLSHALLSNMTTDRLHGYSGKGGNEDGVKAHLVQTIEVEKLPKMLVVHLKRFAVDESMMGQKHVDKLTKHIKFPREFPFAHSFLSSPLPVLPHYVLHSVIVHHGGSSARGHYTAYVRQSTAQQTQPVASNTKQSAAQSSNNKTQTSKTATNNKSSKQQQPAKKVFKSVDDYESEDDEKSKTDSAASGSSDIWFHYDDTRITAVPANTVYQQQAYLLMYEKQED